MEVIRKIYLYIKNVWANLSSHVINIREKVIRKEIRINKYYFLLIISILIIIFIYYRIYIYEEDVIVCRWPNGRINPEILENLPKKKEILHIMEIGSNNMETEIENLEELFPENTYPIRKIKSYRE